LRSGFEERIAADLTKRGIEYEYEPISFTYVVTRRYTPDFRPKTPDVKWLLEAKGYFTPGDRAKTLAVLSAHPGLDLRFCFQNAKNKLNKNSKTTYADWCDKHGIPWCEKTVPAAWFK
jgi:predicted nuclease of restriction endonuclease-like RecB superfamily